MAEKYPLNPFDLSLSSCEVFQISNEVNLNTGLFLLTCISAGLMINKPGFFWYISFCDCFLGLQIRLLNLRDIRSLEVKMRETDTVFLHCSLHTLHPTKVKL